jgi:hypothetical protein
VDAMATDGLIVMNSLHFACRSANEAKSAIRNRLRCRIENHCFTWFSHEQCSSVK